MFSVIKSEIWWTYFQFWGDPTSSFWDNAQIYPNSKLQRHIFQFYDKIRVISSWSPYPDKRGGVFYPYLRRGYWRGGWLSFNPLPIFPSPRVDTLGVGKYFAVEKLNFHDSPYFDKGEGCFAPPQGGYSVSGPTQLHYQDKYNLNTWCQALQHTSRQAYIH